MTKQASALDDPPVGLTLTLLAVNGLLCAVLSVLFLPTWIGAVPFPISILAAAVVNVILVIAARSVGSKVSSGFIPLAGWGVGYVLCMIGGPGGDVLLLATSRTLLLAIGALLPALGYLWFASMKTAARQV